MKNRTIFEPSDFKGAGQMIIRNSYPRGGEDTGFATTVAYKIGFIAGTGLAMISLCDGMIIVIKDRESLCTKLNDDECGYRPMSCDEIARVTAEIGNRFED